MRPVVADVRPLSEDALGDVERRLRVTLPGRVRDILRANNGGRPTPNWVELDTPHCDGATSLALYEFADLNVVVKYCQICASFWDDLLVPKRFLPFAFADADAFFLDMDSETLRVMYWAYLEGDYESHFEGEEMDCVAESIDDFMEAFVEPPE